MRLSKLQKYILNQCYLSKNTAKPKADFYSFYSKKELEKNKRNIIDIVHRSLESMIKKDLIIAYGKKTSQKWFIQKIKLTNEGGRIAQEIIKQRQRKLPIK